MTLDSQLLQTLNQLAEQNLQRKLPEPLRDDILNFSSNDYLGLATHPAVRSGAQATFARTAGSGAARLIGGTHPEHISLEKRLASFKGTEAALLYSSGYQANLGTIAALTSREDAIYCDLLNHASLIDGCRLTHAKLFLYRHLDLVQLKRKLAAGAKHRRRLIITDSVFGMDGDIAPLEELAALAAHHDASLFVDEAHATGIYGPSGAGLVAASGAHADIQLATFGKALGTFGAAITGSRALIDTLASTSRTFIFTTALPPAICAATEAAINIVTSAEGDTLRRQLQANVKRLASGLANIGRPLQNEHCPIMPVHLGTPQAALSAAQHLYERGFFVQAIRPPTVPQGTSRLRIAANATHSPAEIDALLEQLAVVLPDPVPARIQASTTAG